MLNHTDIEEGRYYHITIREDGKDDSYIIIRCDSRDDEFAWTGPTIFMDADDPNNPEFEDGSEDDHGAYFGGETVDDEDDKRIIRYATEEEINWLDKCIEEGEMVDRPEEDKVVVTMNTPSNITPEIIMKHVEELLKNQKSMDKYITELTPDMIGRHIKCRIEGKKVSEALILAEDGYYYMCQDVVDGTSRFKNKGGYKYTYNCGNGANDLQGVGVSVIEFIEKTGKFKVGDWVFIEKNSSVPEMDKFIGRIARITKEEAPGVFRVDVDGGVWNWNGGDFKESGVVSVATENLIKNEIYVYTGSNPSDYIFRSDQTGKSHGHCDVYLGPSKKDYDKSGGGLSQGPFRTATPKEKVHLLACIEAKKYVDPPKDEVLSVPMDIDPRVLIEMILNNQ